MTDRNATAPFALLSYVADIEQVEVVGVERKIQVHVDIAVEVAGDVENAIDLAVRVAIDVGACANQMRALVHRLNQQFVGAGIVE